MLLPQNKESENSKTLKNFKCINKIEKKTLKANEVLKKATANMGLQLTKKYRVPPEEVEKKSTESEEYRLMHNFSRLKKVDKDAERYSRFNRKSDKKSKKNYIQCWQKEK